MSDEQVDAVEETVEEVEVVQAPEPEAMPIEPMETPVV